MVAAALGIYLLWQRGVSIFPDFQKPAMPREHIILECTEARNEGKTPSRYISTRNKKLQKGRVEKKKYNPYLRRHTVHKEIR